MLRACFSTWSAPASRAAAVVPSVDPSLITQTSRPRPISASGAAHRRAAVTTSPIDAASFSAGISTITEEAATARSSTGDLGAVATVSAVDMRFIVTERRTIDGARGASVRSPHV